MTMMPTILQSFQHEILTWQGITAVPHRFGGLEFNLGHVEIGHIHHNGMVDIPFTRPIREALIAEGAAEPHHILPDTGWISYYIHNESDLAGAIALMRLSYLHKSRRRLKTDIKTELAALPFGDRVKQAAGGLIA